MKVQGKVIVVTGAGNGMGRDVTLQLLQAGATVAAVDLNEDMLKETEKLAGGASKNLSLHIVNIADLAAVQELPKAVIAKHGHVDGLMNIAGIIHKFKKVNGFSKDKPCLSSTLTSLPPRAAPLLYWRRTWRNDAVPCWQNAALG